MDSSHIRRVKRTYLLKFLLGMVFLACVAGLTYWLLFVYQVRNIVGLLLIAVFLFAPLVKVIFSLPWEFWALWAVMTSDDPETLDEILGEVRWRS